MRTPPLAIVWATEAIWSGVASIWNWPIAVEPTSSGLTIAEAAGIVLGSAPGMPGSSFQPKSLGLLDQPLGADLDAERGEHGVARVGEAVREVAAARLAVGVRQLDAVDRRGGLDRELVRELDLAGLQRGGGGHDLEGGARAAGGRRRRRRRARGSRRCAGRAPRRRRAGRPARDAAASWTLVSIVVRPAWPGGVRVLRPARASPASSSPPGRPASWSSKTRSSPLTPTGRVAREAARVERLAAPPRRVGASSAPAIEAATAERRAAAVGRALGEHLAVGGQQRARARRAVVRRLSATPGVEAGEDEVGPPVDAPSPTGSSTWPWTAPKTARVRR